MTDLPVPVRLALRRLARRLTLGVFLDVWPTYAAVGIAVAGLTALVCRLFVPAANPYLWWLCLSPIAAMVPAWVVSRLRAYTPDQLVALADSLAGGDGLLLAAVERPNTEWADSTRLATIADRPLPVFRASRRWRLVALAATFLAAMLLLPQRQSTAAASTLLANHMADDVAASVAELKARQVLTPDEEKKLDEEIAQLRKGATKRMDESSWEAADAVKERLAAELAAKRDAVAWAQESLARFAAARAGGAADAQRASGATAGELTAALEQLAKSGMLEGAPAELTDLATGRTSLPTDAAALAKLAEALGRYLGGRRGDLARAASGLRGQRFDPDEFQLAEELGAGAGEGDEPGRGGVNRGRADAPLTWGDETQPFDRFKAQELPPGMARGPDDWAPVAQLPGAPRSSPQVSTASNGRAYADTAGQEAWRRSLAPRHQRAVRKYFDTTAK